MAIYYTESLWSDEKIGILINFFLVSWFFDPWIWRLLNSKWQPIIIKSIFIQIFKKNYIKMNKRRYIKPQDTMLASLRPAWADQHTRGRNDKDSILMGRNGKDSILMGRNGKDSILILCGVKHWVNTSENFESRTCLNKMRLPLD